MSNMLEQAIADAAALREQAIKNAEQSVIEKYSHQIKEAVEQMLEADEDPMSKVEETLNEVEEELNEEETPSPALQGAEQGATVEAPPSWDSRYDDVLTKFSALIDNLPADDSGMIDLDLGDFELEQDEKEAMSDEPTEDILPEPEKGLEASEEKPEGEDTGGDPGGLDDLLSEPLQEGVEIDMDNLAETIADILEEEYVSPSGNMTIDYTPRPTGHIQGKSSPNTVREYEMEAVLEDRMEEEELKEDPDKKEDENDDPVGAINELHETIEMLTKQNQQMESVLSKLERHLEESLLSNAKLLYQNRTLGDASLNERQKTKIVEAIANAESTKEAKQLFETLKATVGSNANSKGPQSLSESVNRRSNLSSMLNSRQNINESKSTDPFIEKMQKLAGIKK